MVTIIEVYNNIEYNPTLIPEKGFSCSLKEADMLFDTGGRGDVLLANMERLGIDPAAVRRLVVSHDHWDHTGGIAAFLGVNPDAEVFIPEGFSRKTLDLIEEYTTPRVVDGWMRITDGIFSTGPLGDTIREQSLAVETPEGFLIVAGCAHPHVGRIIERVREEGPVWGVLGGLHTVSDADVDALGSVAYLSASHCTDRIEDLQERYPAAFRPGGVGRIHRIP